MRKFSMPKKQTSSYIPGLEIGISKAAEKDFLKSVIALRNDDSEVGQTIRNLIKNHIKHPKFPKKILQAPEIFLLDALQDQWIGIPELVFLFLTAWKNANSELFIEIEAWLALIKPDDPSPYQSDDPDAMISEWAEEFSQSHGDFSPETAKLVIAMILKKALFSESESENSAELSSSEILLDETESILSPAWENILSTIQQSLPESYTLDEVEEFLQAVRALTIQHLESQTKARLRQSLREKLAPSLALIDQEKAYFNFHSHPTWQFETVTLEDISALESIFDMLQVEFALRRDLENRRPENKDERKKINDQLEACEEKIQSLYDQITAIFATSETNNTTTNAVYDEPAAQPETETSTPRPSTPELQLDESNSATQPILQSVESSIPAEEVIESDLHPTGDNQSVSQPPAIEEYTSPTEESVSEYDTSWLEEPAPEPEPEISASPEYAELAQPVMGTLADDVHTQIPEEAPAEDLPPEKTAQILHVARQAAATAIRSGDYSRAYWLTLTLEAQNQTPNRSAWALASLQATRWFLQGWPSLSDSLKNEIREIARPTERILVDEDDAYAGLAVAIVMTLFERSMGWENWLLSTDTPENLPHLHALLQRLDEFTRSNLTLEPALVINVLGKEQLGKHIIALSEKARAWLEYAPARRSRFDGAIRAWERVVKKGEPLSLWLEPVTQNDESRLESVRADLKNWSDDVFLDDHIQKTYQRLVGKSKNIQGEARDQLIRWIKEAADIAREWCEAAETPKSVQQRQWNIEQTSALVTFFLTNLPLASQEIKQALEETESPSVGLFGMYQLISDLYGCFQENQPAPDKSPARWQLYNPEIPLQENLAQTLCLYPALSLTEQGMLASDASDFAQLHILSQSPLSPEDAYMAWIKKRDYRFLNRMTLWLPAEQEDHLLRMKKDGLDDDSTNLEKELEKTTISTEQAWVEGLISEEDHVKYDSSVESIRKEYSRLRQEKDNPQASLPDFNHALQKLHGIRSSLHDLRDHRKAKQEEKWQAFLSEMPAIIPEREMGTHLSTLVGRLLHNNDLRTMEELLNLLTDIQNNKKSPDSLKRYIYQEKRPRQKLRDFHKSLPEMVRALEREALSMLGKNYSERLPSERQVEVSDAIQSWLSLKKNGQGLQSENFKHVAQIMRYLGWSISTPSPVSKNSNVPQGFQYWKVQASPRVNIPVPQFGSERSGIYDVIGAWERPATDLIEALANNFGEHRPFILLYFGRMLPHQRSEFRHLTRKKQLPILLVDELLLLFLAREYDVRLTALLECSLPYAYLNPYVPSATANVPPEMFFGREEERRKLKDMYGPSIVYGGRQLGKSALLKQVQREFQRPQANQYAIYEDIRLIGSPASGRNYEQELLDRLLTVLGRENLLPSNARNMDLPRLCDALITHLVKQDARVLLLLDETDNLLETDSKRHFFVVSQLKRVMDQTNRRFKVVFAGLHHVQQFKNIGNQPLAHMGSADAIQIGPMEQGAAIELMKRPLEALGYLFNDQEHEDLSLLLLIFSYANYHPSLLQLFGQYLVDALRERPAGRNMPIETQPYLITRDDIESVYRNPKVRATILERFNITLALDERYEAIALSLILEQLDERNGFDRLFKPQELLQATKFHWRQGFYGMPDEQFTDLLEEMCGLGVLSSVALDTVRYRLRSPNLVYLLGTEDQILSRLVSISKKEGLDKKRILESYHYSHGDTESFDYSPLTYLQEGAIQGKRSGVCLVFGSSATRIYSLESAVRSMVQRSQGRSLIASVSARTGLALKQQLNDFAQANRSEKFLVIYRELSGLAQDMYEQVVEAARFCKHLKDGERKIRVIFEVNEYNAWEWFQIPAEHRLLLERQEAEILSLERWNWAGIRQILELSKFDLLLSDKHLEKIYGMSQGWPVLLEPLGELSQQESNMEILLSKYNKAIEAKTAAFKFVASVDHDLALFVTEMVNTLRMFSDSEPDLNRTTMEDILGLMSESFRLGNMQRFVDYLERMRILRFEPAFVDKVFIKMWYERQQ